jgi:hypothetical protein
LKPSVVHFLKLLVASIHVAQELVASICNWRGLAGHAGGFWPAPWRQRPDHHRDDSLRRLSAIQRRAIALGHGRVVMPSGLLTGCNAAVSAAPRFVVTCWPPQPSVWALGLSILG